MDDYESADWLRQLVSESGFDPSRPDPTLIWNAFKRYATEPLRVETCWWCFEADDGDAGTGQPARIHFGRALDDFVSDNGGGSTVTAAFTAPPGVGLGPKIRCCHSGNGTHSGGLAALPEWFATVESLPAFQTAVGYAGWAFEVKVYGRW